MKKKTLTLALTILFMAGMSTFNSYATMEPDATGTYSDDGCGNRDCDGEPCDCARPIVIAGRGC